MSGSLRKRLILILLLLMLFAWISATVLTVIASSRVLIDQVDRQLNQYSELVYYMTQIFAQGNDEQLMEAHPGLEDIIRAESLPIIIAGDSGEDLVPALNVWQGDTLIAALDGSPRFEHPEQEGFAFEPDPSGKGGWRILVRHHTENDLWLLVGIDLDRARWQILQVLGRAIFPLLIVLPLTIVVLYFGVSRGLKPLESLALQISRRSPQLMEPIEQGDVPAEIKPVVESLNELLRRLGEALESEQRFTANAAHELQTPLAAIKTEVQLCQRQVNDESTRAMLERIALRVDRASHTVRQLLTLARLDPEAELDMTSVELRELLGEVIAETAHVAADNDLSVEFPDGPPLPLQAEPEAIAILLRNALLNAFRYATPGSEVSLSLQQGADSIRVRLENDCEPIAARDFEQLKERFYRVPGSAGTGAGLGLSIMQRVVNRHHANMQLETAEDGRGFVLNLIFPAA